MAEAKGEHGTDADLLRNYVIRVAGFKKTAVNPRSDWVHDLDESLHAFSCDRGRVSGLGPCTLFPQQVPLLIKHCLEVALAAILQDQAPIGRVVT